MLFKTISNTIIYIITAVLQPHGRAPLCTWGESVYVEGSVPKFPSYYDLMEQNFNSQVPTNILWCGRFSGPFTEQVEKGGSTAGYHL